MVDVQSSLIQRRDRRYRRAQAAFMVVTVLGLLGISWLVYAGIQLQFQRLNQLNQSRRNETQAQLDQLSGYVKCVAVIFAEHEQGTVTIEDLDTCKIRGNVPQSGLQGVSQIITPEQVFTVTPQPTPAPAAVQLTPSPTPSPQPSAVRQLSDFVLAPVRNLVNWLSAQP